MASFQKFLSELLSKACANRGFNIFFGIVWLLGFLGGTGYLFFYSGEGTPKLFGFVNLFICLFLLAKSYAGMKDDLIK